MPRHVRNALSLVLLALGCAASAVGWAQTASPTAPPDPDEEHQRPPISAEDSANVDAKASAPSGAIIDESRTPEERRASRAEERGERPAQRARERRRDRAVPAVEEPATGGQGAVTSRWSD